MRDFIPVYDMLEHLPTQEKARLLRLPLYRRFRRRQDEVAALARKLMREGGSLCDPCLLCAAEELEALGEKLLAQLRAHD